MQAAQGASQALTFIRTGVRFVSGPHANLPGRLGNGNAAACCLRGEGSNPPTAAQPTGNAPAPATYKAHPP